MNLARPLKLTFISAMLVALATGCASEPTDRRIGVAIEDTAISARVKAALAGDPDVKARDVQVETFRGVVQLSGFVDSHENVQRALDVARRVNGVREVKNALIVK
ncbi:BON domain-containing protein [Massilia pseudoviolaceinigra]|uniref:BON domain-containing protein n=1 Tax=Massilia pseudoviolaceinigra TaxID=3057165 RepID=UPI0027964C2E|nr:BON domain-containing protein [Massilia sp. CCM 9206]MDQ1921560.1 BON domain-containing protein [Massilia sp. CCM 9206]